MRETMTQPTELLERRLWQGGFRFIPGRDGEYYALSVYARDEADTRNISPLVRAYHAGAVTVGRFLAECCRLFGLPEFDPQDSTNAENDA